RIGVLPQPPLRLVVGCVVLVGDLLVDLLVALNNRTLTTGEIDVLLLRDRQLDRSLRGGVLLDLPCELQDGCEIEPRPWVAVIPSRNAEIAVTTDASLRGVRD